MSADGKEYEIRAIGDVLTIPPSRMGAFCLDLMRWHEIAVAAQAILPEEVTMPLEVFKWRDDGMYGLREVTIHVVNDPKDTP